MWYRERGRVRFFFFQAEDGIRDKLVTGVQTCALPIWSLSLLSAGLGPSSTERAATEGQALAEGQGPARPEPATVVTPAAPRWPSLPSNGSSSTGPSSAPPR